MPTNRKRRSRHCRRPALNESERQWLYDEPIENDWFLFCTCPQDLKALWERHRDEVLSWWIRKRPGTRPSNWWEFDAPRKPKEGNGCWWDGKLAEPRLRLGGIGTPKYEVLNYRPSFRFGLPTTWVNRWEVELYNGRAKDIHGKPIGTEYHEGHFKADAIDFNKPPMFESQAAYLKRHGLLLGPEARVLPPRAFEPEAVTDVIEIGPLGFGRSWNS